MLRQHSHEQKIIKRQGNCEMYAILQSTEEITLILAHKLKQVKAKPKPSYHSTTFLFLEEQDVPLSYP